jgi:flagellar assembly factor FliW
MVNAPAEGVTTVDLPRFGTVTYAETEVLVFPWGIPGFEDLRSFLLLSLESQEQLLWLQSLDDVAVSLPLCDPWQFFPDYEPKLPGFARLSLDLERPEDFVILCVTVVPESGPIFLNLMAPIVVNLRTRVARQIALEGGTYSVATPVPETAAGQAEGSPA